MISKSHLVLASALFLLVSVWLPGQERPQPVRANFERFAREIVLLGPAEFLRGFRDSRRIPLEDFARVRAFADFLESGNWKTSDFLPLIKHPDPKVRTLALVALYSLDDPNVLPDIFGLVSDTGTSFLAMRPFASSAFMDRANALKMTEAQTVGKVATDILDTYLKSGSYFYGPLGLNGEPGFVEYWKAHAGRSTSAGWWNVRLARAGHSTLPTPRERYAAIAMLRTQLDMLSEPDRTLTLLSLLDEYGADALVTSEELTDLLKQLGSDVILDFLKRKVPTNDPDLQPNRGPYSSMRLFILQKSDALLPAEAANALLDQEIWERDFQKHGFTDPLINPWWAIGAAQLNRRETASILREVYARFQGQYDSAFQLELAGSLWRLGGEDQASVVVDWIYKELAKPMGLESNMLEGILKTEGRRNPVLARTLIEDSRFDELNWKSLEVLAKAVNSWTKKEVVSVQELESSWSPIGSDFFMRDKSKALEQYPKEIAALSDTLSRWRQALRASAASLSSIK